MSRAHSFLPYNIVKELNFFFLPEQNLLFNYLLEDVCNS